MSTDALPDYVAIDDETQSDALKLYLTTPAQPVSFPLSPEDLNDLAILEAKFDQEENMAGLAAPQIGIHKQMIIFATPKGEGYKKFRPDLTQTIEKTIWLNPTYTPIGTETREDFEACFSVLDKVGTVKRHTDVTAHAYTPDGTPVTLEAEGFLARIIQHETDHVHGELFIDKAVEGSLMTRDEYIRRRNEAMGTS